MDNYKDESKPNSKGNSNDSTQSDENNNNSSHEEEEKIKLTDPRENKSLLKDWNLKEIEGILNVKS